MIFKDHFVSQIKDHMEEQLENKIDIEKSLLRFYEKKLKILGKRFKEWFMLSDYLERKLQFFTKKNKS